MLTLSIPAAPRLRFTLRKASSMSVWVIRPVNECALILATGRSFPAELQVTSDDRRRAVTPWRMFLSTVAAPEGLGPPRVGLSQRANCPHCVTAKHLFAPVPPLTDSAPVSGSATPEKLPSPNVQVRRTRAYRGVASPFRGTYGTGLSGQRRNRVGLSPVSVIGRCDQATPPTTSCGRKT